MYVYVYFERNIVIYRIWEDTIEEHQIQSRNKKKNIKQNGVKKEIKYNTGDSKEL